MMKWKKMIQTGDTEDGEWNDYSLDGEQSDIECEAVTDALDY